MAVDGTVSHDAVIIIQTVQQLLAGEDLPRLVGEGFQQAEFGGGEIQQLAAPARLEAAFIDDKWAFRVQYLQFTMGLTAAQNGFYARDHFTRAVWLADVIIRANFEAQQAVDLFDFRRHHHHRHV